MLISMNIKKLYCLFGILIIFYNSNSQTIYPPNYSFENDTSAKSISPWIAKGDISFGTSINMFFAPDSIYFISLVSVTKPNQVINSEIHNTFSLSTRPHFLEYDCYYSTPYINDKFKTKLTFFKMEKDLNKTIICELDSLMDSICVRTNYRDGWYHVKINLDHYYLNDQVPDSCYLEINATQFFPRGLNNGLMLALDNIYFSGTSKVSVKTLKLETTQIKINPNPANTLISIDLSEIQSVESFQLINLIGETLWMVNSPMNNFDLDVSGYPSGLYIVRVCDTFGNAMVRKIQIQ